MLTRTLLAALATSALLALPVMAMADTVLIETPQGDIEIELLTEDAPKTVANFLNYIENGKYIKSFIHRSEAGFVIQGGGFTFNDINPVGIIPFASVEIVEANLVMTAVSKKDVTPVTENFVMNTGLNDAWYNPITTGQGFFIKVFPVQGVVSLSWFTYDTDLPAGGESAKLGYLGHRWLNAVGNIEGDTAVLNIDIASGGLFDTATTIEHTTPPGSYGTITLTFTDCSSGLVEYDIPQINRQGSVPIQRVAGNNIALCEALSAP